MTYNRVSKTVSTRVDREALWICQWEAALRGSHLTSEIRDWLEERAERIAVEHPELVIPEQIRIVPLAVPEEQVPPEEPVPVQVTEGTLSEREGILDEVDWTVVKDGEGAAPGDLPGDLPDVTVTVEHPDGTVDEVEGTVEQTCHPDAVAFCARVSETLGGLDVDELLAGVDQGEDGLWRVEVNGIPFTSEAEPTDDH